MKILGIIPARYASTRFPGKPLVDIQGKPMVQQVYNQAKKSLLLDRLIVATDHTGIFDVVNSFGGEAVMTSESHSSGTERCFEAIQKLNEDYDYVINIQGDEPFIHFELIDQCASLLDGKTELATMIARIHDIEVLFNPNVAKVIINKNNEAIYFSREAIPYLRDVEKSKYLEHHIFYKHASIYAYRTDILKAISTLSVGDLEEAEKLEQLRWIEYGFKIKTGVTQHESFGIDTEEDLLKALDKFGKKIEQ